MTESDRKALMRLAGGEGGSRATTDDLQGLLLQVSLALLMIFMIAYFIFVAAAKKEQEEQVLDLNRQKLVLALDKVAEQHRVRYGLNALMTQGTDGRRTFDADEHVAGGALSLAPAAKTAFASGSAAARSDFADRAALETAWRQDVLESAGLAETPLTPGEEEWLSKQVAENVEAVRLDARGVQRALAARLQRQWIANPGELKDIVDAGELADTLKARSLKLVSEAIGTEVLP